MNSFAPVLTAYTPVAEAPVAQSIINRTLLADNACFGCGHENPNGLQVEIFDEVQADGSLRARFTPTKDMAGFPGMTHGGVLFAAMDCLSTWVATLLGPNRKAAWVLRFANTLYHNPAFVEQPLTLQGWIKHQSGSWEPLTVHVETRRADGTLCVEADFKVVPLSTEKLVKIAGLEQLPVNWQTFYSEMP